MTGRADADTDRNLQSARDLGESNPIAFNPLAAVVMGMEQTMGLMAVGLTQALLVELLDDMVFLRTMSVVRGIDIANDLRTPTPGAR